jgi:hypothetical protein
MDDDHTLDVAPGVIRDVLEQGLTQPAEGTDGNSFA